MTVQHSHPRLRPTAGPPLPSRRTAASSWCGAGGGAAQNGRISDPSSRPFAAPLRPNTICTVDAIVLIKAGTIPKTSSGKIQRHACRARFLDGTLDAVGHWRAWGERRRPSARGAGRQAAAPDVATTTALPAARADSKRRPPTRCHFQATVEIVLEEVRRIAKERAAGLTLDSPDHRDWARFVGADGDPRLAGRTLRRPLSRRSCRSWKPARQVIDAVEKYLGGQPRSETAQAAAENSPPENYRFELFPEYLKLRQTVDQSADAGPGQSVFQRPPGHHQRSHRHRRPRVDQLSQLQLRGHVGRPGRRQGRQGGHRPLRHQRVGQPAGLRRKGPAPRVGAGDRRLPRHRGRDHLRRRPRHQ